MQQFTDKTIKISQPEQLTYELHRAILLHLRSDLDALKKAKADQGELQKLRIRNWLFFYEDGLPVVDIIIDKGYIAVDTDAKTLKNNTDISLDECAAVHDFILNNHALDALDDNLTVRIGSPGLEPTLYDTIDFQSVLENVIKVDLWHPEDGKKTFTMTLADISDKDDFLGIRLTSLPGKSDPRSLDVPFHNIKSATALFRPKTKQRGRK